MVTLISPPYPGLTPVPHLRPFPPQAANFADTISQRGLVQWVIEPTFHSLNRNYHCLLDLIFTDDAPRITGLAHLNPLFPSAQSHDTLQFSYLVRCNSAPPPKLRRKTNYEKLVAHFQNLHWNTLLGPDVESMYNTFTSIYHHAVDVCISAPKPQTRRYP